MKWLRDSIINLKVRSSFRSVRRLTLLALGGAVLLEALVIYNLAKVNSRLYEYAHQFHAGGMGV